jgi:GH15 family glucan-1,4-alpha-glucosidase
VCENWDQPDEGIWETRGGRKDFTYGRFQTWVAVDRADPMWISTLEAMDRELVSDSLVYRYNPLPHPMGWPVTRAPSPCAPSGTSTPWPAPGDWTRQG